MGELDPSITYDVTYVVKGDESGPIIDTLEVTGDQYSQPSEQDASTESNKVKLTARVVTVSPQ